MLENDANAQIIDIRSKKEAREDGVPNLRSTKKTLISIPYQPPQGPTPQTSAGTVSVGWAQRIARMKKVRTAPSLERSTSAARVWPWRKFCDVRGQNTDCLQDGARLGQRAAAECPRRLTCQHLQTKETDSHAG